MPDAGEHWVCGSCRSLNEGRADRCYKCRTPRALVEADPTQLIVAGVGATESRLAASAAAAAAVRGQYRSSSMRAATAQWLIVATITGTVISSVTGADAVAAILAGNVAEGLATRPLLLLLGVVNLALAASALVAWAAWLSRVIENVPTVGLGWPAATPTSAFLENFLPGLNLLRVPSIVRDVARRLEPGGGRGESLIAAAWLGLFGGLIVPRVAGFVLPWFSASIADLLTESVVVSQVALGLTIVGAAFLIALIHRVENGMRMRAGVVTADGSSAVPASA
jgi:hypothetical protein